MGYAWNVADYPPEVPCRPPRRLPLISARSRTLAVVLLAAVLLAVPLPVRAAPPTPRSNDVPALIDFARSLENGNASELRGIHVRGIMALRVVRQPPGHSEYVSNSSDAITLFDSATRAGSTGLLAHNFLAGHLFSALETGQSIHLVYGDGRVSEFRITRVLRYRALQPASTRSSFEDLQDGRILDARALFMETYGTPRALVLQTCIASGSELSWGRLFVVATKVRPHADPRVPNASGIE